jgi:hypothetical protein
MFRRNSKWISWSLVFVVAVCLFGPAAVSYGSSDSQNITDEDCNTILDFFDPWGLSGL